MSNKFLVSFLDAEGNTTKTEEFKSYKNIADKLNIGYHIVRDIHLIGLGQKTKKFYHKDLTTLLKKIKITTIEKTYDF